MTSTTLDRDTSTHTSRKYHPDWKVIVLNDNHNTFDHVVKCLVQIIPNTTPEKAWEIAETIHYSGLAVVWTGPLEQAEMYHLQLGIKGLTMASLESE